MRRAPAAALDAFGAEASGLRRARRRVAAPRLDSRSHRAARGHGGVARGVHRDRRATPTRSIRCARCSRAPGDIAFVESPTYHLGLRILQDHHLDLRPVPTDAEGLRVDVLAAQLRQLRVARAARPAAVHDSDVPQPDRRQPLGRAPPRARRPRRRARPADRRRRCVSGADLRRRRAALAVLDGAARHGDAAGVVREVARPGAEAWLGQLQRRAGATVCRRRAARQRRRAELQHRR